MLLKKITIEILGWKIKQVHALEVCFLAKDACHREPDEETIPEFLKWNENLDWSAKRPSYYPLVVSYKEG